MLIPEGEEVAHQIQSKNANTQQTQPEISKAQQFAYLTLLNKMTAKDDLLKPSIKK